jgi:MFS family permease
MLLIQRKYWPLFWTQFFGAFNDNLFKNSLMILIAYRGYHLGIFDSKQMSALTAGVFILPFFIFSAISGELAEKFPKNRLMQLVKVIEILIMINGLAGFIYENVALLMISLFLMGVHSTMFGPVKYSVIPELVEPNELVEANALIEMGTFLAILTGTILAGFLVNIPEDGPMYAGLGCILVAAIGTLASIFIKKLPSVVPHLKIDWNIFTSTKKILKITHENPKVLTSVLANSWFWFFGVYLLTIFPLYAKNVLHAESFVVTFFLALFSVGVAIGSIMCEKIGGEKNEFGLVVIGSIGMTIFCGDLFFLGTPNFVVTELRNFIENFSGIRLIIDLVGISICGGLFIVPLYVHMQKASAPEIRSRIIAGSNIYNAIFMVVASVVLMVLFAQGVDEINAIGVLAILNLISTIVIWKLMSNDLNILIKRILK